MPDLVEKKAANDFRDAVGALHTALVTLGSTNEQKTNQELLLSVQSAIKKLLMTGKIDASALTFLANARLFKYLDNETRFLLIAPHNKELPLDLQLDFIVKYKSIDSFDKYVNNILTITTPDPKQAAAMLFNFFQLQSTTLPKVINKIVWDYSGINTLVSYKKARIAHKQANKQQNAGFRMQDAVFQAFNQDLTNCTA